MNPKPDNGIKAFQVLRRYLDDGGWNAEEMTDQFAFMAKGEDELSTRVYYFQVKIELEQFLFYIQPDITLLSDMLPSVAEFVARANFGMRIGNFEVDYGTCRVCFRSSINFKGIPLSKELVEGVIAPALEAYDEYFPGLARVIAGIDTPAKAIREIEYGE